MASLNTLEAVPLISMAARLQVHIPITHVYTCVKCICMRLVHECEHVCEHVCICTWVCVCVYVYMIMMKHYVYTHNRVIERNLHTVSNGISDVPV